MKKFISHIPLRIMNAFNEPVIGSMVDNIHPRTVINIERSMHGATPVGNLVEAIKSEAPTIIKNINRELENLEKRRIILLEKKAMHERLMQAVSGEYLLPF